MRTLPLEVKESMYWDEKNLIEAWMIYRNLTQKNLASLMGVTQSAIANICKVNNPKKETISKLSKALNVEPEQLVIEQKTYIYWV